MNEDNVGELVGELVDAVMCIVGNPLLSWSQMEPQLERLVKSYTEMFLELGDGE